MGGNAGWVDYERAFQAIAGGREACLDRETLKSEASVAARAATAEPAEPRAEGLERAREVTDLLDRMVNLLLLVCACGLRIKVPAGFAKAAIQCPRCGREHPVPRAETGIADAAAAAVTLGALGAPLRYRRRSQGWESFECGCGVVQQLSPGLGVSTITCRSCKRKIEIETPGARTQQARQ